MSVQERVDNIFYDNVKNLSSSLTKSVFLRVCPLCWQRPFHHSKLNQFKTVYYKKFIFCDEKFLEITNWEKN